MYIQRIAGLGVLVLLTAWLPMLLKKMALSLPILWVGVGAALFSAPALGPFALHPLQFSITVERIAELVVIISLMDAGINIDRLMGWHRCLLTWRLLAVAMPLTILLVAIFAQVLLGFGVAAALLIGAVLAPTDPVRASDVQVSGPGEGEEDEARFALTSETGLDDGFAFPFVYLAIALARASFGVQDAAELFLRDLLWKTVAGLAAGYAIGRGLGYLTCHLPDRTSPVGSGDQANFKWAQRRGAVGLAVSG